MGEIADLLNCESASDAGAKPDFADALAIQSLVAAYFQRTDRLGGQPVSDLFVEASVLVLGKLELVGRDAIARFFAERCSGYLEAQRHTRHMSGLVDLTSESADRVIGRSTAAVFAGSGDLPLMAGVPSTICDFDDVYVRTSAGWLFEERRATLIFTGPGAATFTK